MANARFNAMKQEWRGGYSPFFKGVQVGIIRACLTMVLPIPIFFLTLLVAFEWSLSKEELGFTVGASVLGLGLGIASGARAQTRFERRGGKSSQVFLGPLIGGLCVASGLIIYPFLADRLAFVFVACVGLASGGYMSGLWMVEFKGVWSRSRSRHRGPTQPCE